MIAIGRLLYFLLDVYMWIIIAEVVISWLIVFDVINVRNPKAQNLLAMVAKITSPVMKPIRKYIPPVAGLDLSPIVAIFGIMLLQGLVTRVFLGY
jgi:YggT family protein